MIELKEPTAKHLTLELLIEADQATTESSKREATELMGKVVMRLMASGELSIGLVQSIKAEYESGKRRKEESKCTK